MPGGTPSADADADAGAGAGAEATADADADGRDADGGAAGAEAVAAAGMAGVVDGALAVTLGGGAVVDVVGAMGRVPVRFARM